MILVRVREGGQRQQTQCQVHWPAKTEFFSSTGQPWRAVAMSSRRPKAPFTARLGVQSGFWAKNELLSPRRIPTKVSATIRPPTGPSFRVLIFQSPLVVLIVTSVSTVSARTYVQRGQFSLNAA